MTDDLQTQQQLPLEFTHRNDMGRDDFMVSECNEAAFRLIDSWPQWFGSGLFIYGPKGCGKSHLAHLFADKVKTASTKPVAVKIIDAAAVNMRNVKRLATENAAIVIENVAPSNNNEALFHLFNLFNVSGKYMLWTAQTAPNKMNFGLKDLQTRLNMLPRTAIYEPDDSMLQMLIVKLFNDRQITISAEILKYMLTNAQRSFAYIESLVEEIDKISLARQSAVNYAVVKKAMELLLEDKCEPDLFDEI